MVDREFVVHVFATFPSILRYLSSGRTRGHMEECVKQHHHTTDLLAVLKLKLN